jgi:predicted nucleotidyltransferase
METAAADRTGMADLFEQMEVRLPDWASDLVFAGVRGSDAHGTKLDPGHSMATDDTDVFGVFKRHPYDYLGLPYHPKSNQQFATDGEDLDILVYDIRKFFYLAAKGNPNVLSWLWARPEDHFLPNDLLVKNRDVFMSRQVLDALVGYSRAQLRKMERSEYAGYMGKKRKTIVDRVGYDVKHAAHCVRLLLMGQELCTQGTMHTYRPDHERKLLVGIKAGHFPLRDIKQIADLEFRRFQDLERQSDLPQAPDLDEINVLLVTMITGDR